MRISDWSSDVCSSDLAGLARDRAADLRRASGAGVDRGLKQVGDPGGDPIVDQHLPAFGLALIEQSPFGGRPLGDAIGVDRYAPARARGKGGGHRSEEARVGNEGVSQGRSRWSAY